MDEEKQIPSLPVTDRKKNDVESAKKRKMIYDLIEKTGLKPVVFHSLRHSSTTNKLKISGGDI